MQRTDIATYNVAQFFRYGRVLNGAKIENKKDDISFYRGPVRRFFTELYQILGIREKLRNFDNSRRESIYTKKY